MNKLFLQLAIALLLSLSPTYAVDPFCFITIEKSGTNMLSPVLSILSQKKGVNSPIGPHSKNLWDIPLQDLHNITKNSKQYLKSHTRYSTTAAEILRKAGYKVIFLLRDPRDQVVSLARYIKQPSHRTLNPEKKYHNPLSQATKRLYSLTKQEKLEDIITELIIGGPHNYQARLTSLSIENVRDSYAHRLGWLQYENTFLIRFEDLVGPYGGGNTDIQIQVLNALAEFLNISVDEEKILNIASNVYGPSPTFRPGSKIGRWRDYFTPEHKKLFKEIAGNLLINLGYEQDYNW